MVVWSHVGLAGLWGGLLALERRAFLQAMFSRPLVAATGMGVLLDDVASGLFVGLVLELFFLGSASLGAALPENDTLSATCCSAVAATLGFSGGGGTAALWSLSILFFIGTGHLGRQLDRALERYSSRLVTRAVHETELGALNRAVRQNLWGMWPHFVCFGGVSAGCALFGYLVAPAVHQLPLAVVRGLAWAYPAMASVAAAIAARGSHARNASLLAGLAAAVVTALGAFATFGRGP